MPGPAGGTCCGPTCPSLQWASPWVAGSTPRLLWCPRAHRPRSRPPRRKPLSEERTDPAACHSGPLLGGRLGHIKAPRRQKGPHQGVTEQAGNRTAKLQKKTGGFTLWGRLGAEDGRGSRGQRALEGQMADEHTRGLRVKPQTQEVPGRLPEDISAALDTEGPTNPRAPRPLLPWLLQEALSRCPAEGRQPRRLRTEHRVAGRPARLTEHGAPACTSFSGSFPQVPLPRSTAGGK